LLSDYRGVAKWFGAHLVGKDFVYHACGHEFKSGLK